MLRLFAHVHMGQFECIINALCADLNVHVHTVLFMYVCGGRLATSTVSDVLCFQINETLTFLFRKRERKRNSHIQGCPLRRNVT